MWLTIAAILFSLVVAHGVFGFLPLPARAIIFSGVMLSYMVIFLREELAVPATPLIVPRPVPQRVAVPQVVSNPVKTPVKQVSHEGGFYAREAALIERLLQEDYKIQCDVGRSPYLAHTYVGYPISVRGSKTYADIEKILEVLASRLAEDFARDEVMPIDPETGAKRLVSITLDRDSQPPILQVTRPRIKMLSWAGTEGWARDPLDVVFGCKVVYDRVKGSRVVPVTVPMRNTDRTSFLFLGISQSGKSTLMNAALVRLLRANSPDRLQVWICDPKGVFFEPYQDVAHVQDWTNNVGDAAIMLEEFKRLCTDGSQERSDVYRLLIIDEWHQLVKEDPTLVATLKTIVNSGATKNIRVWVSATEVEREIIPQPLKNAFHVISSHYNRNETYIRGTLGISGTTSLVRRYESILIVDSHTTRISTFNFTEAIFMQELQTLPRKIAERHHEVRPVLTQEEELNEHERLRRQVYLLKGNPEASYRGKLTANKVHAILRPGRGRGPDSDYPIISELVREVNGD